MFRLISKRHISFNPEYAFEMSSSTIRFGRGVTKEIGSDLSNLGLKDNICVITDQNMVHLEPFKKVIESLTAAGIKFKVFDNVSVEPTDKSLEIAIKYSRENNFNGFVAVGGGSVIDTAKVVSFYLNQILHYLLNII